MPFAYRGTLRLAVLSLSLICTASAQSQSSSSVPNSPPTSAGQNSTDEAALRALVEAFFNTWAAKDLDGFLHLWSAKSPELEARKQSTSALFGSSEKIEVRDLVLDKLK